MFNISDKTATKEQPDASPKEVQGPINLSETELAITDTEPAPIKTATSNNLIANVLNNAFMTDNYTVKFDNNSDVKQTIRMIIKPNDREIYYSFMTPWVHARKGREDEYLRFPYGEETSPFDFEKLKELTGIDKEVAYYTLYNEATADMWNCEIPELGTQLLYLNDQCGFLVKPALQSIQNVFTTSKGTVNIPVLVGACVAGALILLGILYLFTSSK